MRARRTGWAVAAAVLLLVACGGSGQALTVKAALPADLDPCTGANGDPGYETAQITVRDGSGETIAQGRLGPKETETIEGVEVCTWTVELEVPDGDFYTVQVGNQNETRFTKEELEGADWETLVLVTE